MITLAGTWKNIETGELIKLNGPNNGDNFLLEFDFQNGQFQRSEIVQIFIGGKNDAILEKSEKFKNKNIEFISDSSIRISGTLFSKTILPKL